MSDSMNQRMGSEHEINYLDEEDDSEEDEEYWEMERQHRQE